MFHLILFLVFLIVIPVVFLISRYSRKRYVCSECGNSVVVEHLKANRCDVCGACFNTREICND